jgi:hypothetical protein
MSNFQDFSAKNYLVPAGGATHGVVYSNNLSATADVIDWRSYSLNNFPFIPQGAFIDNSQGTADLVINIMPINYNVVCPAGITKQSQFPAMQDMQMYITGNGLATITFVDFPVLPDSGLVNIGNTVGINITGFNYVGALPVLPAINNGGIPYQVTNLPILGGTAYQAAITGTATSATITPTSTTGILHRLVCTLSGDAAFATAGSQTITCTLNGITIYRQSFYLGAVALAGQCLIPLINEQFNAYQLGAGTGNLVVTLGAALSAGTLSINAVYVG